MNNLVTRTISGIIFLVIMVAGIWFSEYSYAALFLFIMLSTMLEFHRMTIAPGRHIWARVLTLVSAVTLFSTIFLWQRFGISPRFILLSLIPVLLASGGSIFEKVKDDYITVAYAYTSFVYIALPLSIASLAVFRDGVYDGTLLLCFFGIIWGSDVGAYCLGCTLGRNSRKMCPKISPKKSWWGFLAGGIVLAAVSLMIRDNTLSTIVGAGAFSFFWGIGEVIAQEKRVLKGWFPENPKRHEYYEKLRKRTDDSE